MWRFRVCLPKDCLVQFVSNSYNSQLLISFAFLPPSLPPSLSFVTSTPFSLPPSSPSVSHSLSLPPSLLLSLPLSFSLPLSLSPSPSLPLSLPISLPLPCISLPPLPPLYLPHLSLPSLSPSPSPSPLSPSLSHSSGGRNKNVLLWSAQITHDHVIQSFNYSHLCLNRNHFKTIQSTQYVTQLIWYFHIFLLSYFEAIFLHEDLFTCTFTCICHKGICRLSFGTL